MSRRSGLKKIHANFSDIYRKLNDAYTKNARNEKIVGGVVGIWAKMCVDAVLRNRLVHEGTFIQTHHAAKLYADKTKCRAHIQDHASHGHAFYSSRWS